MISHFINEPDHWRARAEEARMLANQMNDSESRDAMLRIAEDYERLAKRAEDRTVGRLPNRTTSRAIHGSAPVGYSAVAGRMHRAARWLRSQILPLAQREPRERRRVVAPPP